MAPPCRLIPKLGAISSFPSYRSSSSPGILSLPSPSCPATSLPSLIARARKEENLVREKIFCPAREVSLRKGQKIPGSPATTVSHLHFQDISYHRRCDWLLPSFHPPIAHTIIIFSFLWAITCRWMVRKNLSDEP